ncbi:MAG: helix-turn-helix domain-containing protein [Anaerolineales bacterium]|nr:helix-turn-helix domain-containing protein [Anaerolineales bacterium]
MSDLSVPAAERTLRLLELLLVNPQGVTARDCSKRLDISRSTLFSLLQTLKTLGYVEQTKVRGYYRAGPRLLAWRRTGRVDPQDLISAFYQETTAPPIDETIALVVPSAPTLLILAQRESSHRVRTGFNSGQRLAHDEIAAGPLFETPPSDELQNLGYYLEERAGTVELAFPICEDGNHPSAALLISAPIFRSSREDLLTHLTALREMAARLSYRLGAPVYAPFKGPALSNIEPTSPLSEQEITAFLKGPWVASLACLRPDGTPHVVPVWHEWDGLAFHVAAWIGSRWADYVMADPRVSLTVDEPWPPLRRVLAKGTAQPLEEDAIPGGTFSILERLSTRFLGQTLSPELAARPWRAFIIHPEQIRGWRGLRIKES